MTGPRARPVPGARAAAFAGALAGFVALVDLTRAVRLSLLLDPDPSWAVPRLLLGLGVAASAGAAAALAASALLLWARSPRSSLPPVPVPFSRTALAAVALTAVLLGSAARFVALSRVPAFLFLDDVSLIDPTLAFTGTWKDFADAIRPVPFGVKKLFGTVGVLYLEAFRATLRLFGTTVFGLRFLSAAAGAASLVTAGLLARALLPRGGGTLAVLALAGLRWHLILSRWGWNMIVLAPIVDVATLLLLRARRRGGTAAAAAGVVAGLGAHVYLSAWIAGVALASFCVSPGARDDSIPSRVRRALLFAAGFALAAAPLFLFREGRAVGYFARTRDHNVLHEIRYRKSPEPLFAAAADGLVAPWLAPDPTSRHDLPGRSRLGWILGVPALVAFARCLLEPREELSGLLLSHAGAALSAAVVAGQAGNPNGARFGYLTTVTAVAVAAGVQLLLSAVGGERRRAAALLAAGLLAVSGALAARDALLVWPERAETFEGFHGGDTLVARAALRWESVADVEVAPEIGHSDVTIGAIRRHRLDPDAPPPASGTPRRLVRIVAPAAAAGPGERLVERVTLPGGAPAALVFARKRP